MSFLLATAGARMLREVGGLLFFVAGGPDTGAELWTSDGSAAGTAIVREIRPGAAGAFPDCAQPGACPVPASLADLDGVAYFAADDGLRGVELWRSDGSAAGTSLVRDVRPGPASSHPGPFASAKGALHFAADDGVHGVELWRSDGTRAGTALVADLAPGPASSNPRSLTATAEGIFFTTSAADGSGSALHRSDGTAAGTLRVKELGCATPLAAIGGTLYFRALGPEGIELWRSDGTAAGTRLVRDISPGPRSSSPLQLAPIGALLFFRANGGASGAELWRSDGTPEGTRLVKDIHPPRPGGRADSTPIHLKAFRDGLAFGADDGAHGFELWTSDGSEAGTALVRDIWPGSGSSDPHQLRALVGTLLFSADDGQHGIELWRSDGSAAGTALVADLRPGRDGSSPYWLTLVGERLFFRADDGDGPALFRSDGTREGTRRVLHLPKND